MSEHYKTFSPPLSWHVPAVDAAFRHSGIKSARTRAVSCEVRVPAIDGRARDIRRRNHPPRRARIPVDGKHCRHWIGSRACLWCLLGQASRETTLSTRCEKRGATTTASEITWSLCHGSCNIGHIVGGVHWMNSDNEWPDDELDHDDSSERCQEWDGYDEGFFLDEHNWADSSPDG